MASEVKESNIELHCFDNPFSNTELKGDSVSGIINSIRQQNKKTTPKPYTDADLLPLVYSII
jgi:hypothetical protein